MQTLKMYQNFYRNIACPPCGGNDSVCLSPLRGGITERHYSICKQRKLSSYILSIRKKTCKDLQKMIKGGLYEKWENISILYALL